MVKIPLHWDKRIILIIGILGVSSAAIFIRLCQQQVSPVTIGFSLFIAASRLLITSILLFPNYRHLSQINSGNRAVLYSLGAGICLAFHFATWITSLNFTSVAASVSLVTTNPLWVALLSWWFTQQKISPKTIVGIIIAISGSILITFAGGESNFGSNPLIGAILALLGAWFASGYIILGKLAQEKGFTTSQYIMIAYLVAGICLFPMPLIAGVSYLGHSALIYLYLFLMAIVCQIIGHTSLNWCLRSFSTTTISLLILFEPVVSSIMAWWLFTEIPPPLVIIGALIILTGVLIADQ